MTSANGRQENSMVETRLSSGIDAKTSSNNSRLRKLNPEFTAAHGLSIESSGGCSVRRQKLAFDNAVSHARSSGKLNLANLGLTARLPDECFDLRKIMPVDLSLDSYVKSWECYGEEALISVDFSDNDLSSSPRCTADEKQEQHGCLDARIERYRSLKCLRAKRCSISSLPLDSLRSIQFLSVLDFSGNRISHPIPLNLLPPTLTEVDLSFNQIPSLYDGNVDCQDCFTILPLCKSLNVSGNRLNSLFPAEKKIDGLTNLQTLVCGDNQLCGQLFSDEVVVNLRSLQTLEASKNMLSVAPLLGALDKLTLVYLSDNKLEAVPTINLAVTRLALSNNQISTLDGLFTSLPPLLQRSELVELSLRGNKLQVLDQEILTICTKLTLLDVGCNDLSDIPYVLGYLPDLRKVILDGNPLRVIRPSLAEDMVALKKSLRCKGARPEGSDFLYAEGGASSEAGTVGNKDISRSAAFSAFKTSHTLDLANMSLEVIPEAVRSELRVEVLDTEDNNSTTAGNQLKSLKLRGNLFRDFEPNMFDDMMNLNSVDAGSNKIYALTARFEHVPLTFLSLEKNLLTSDAIVKSSLCCREQISTPLLRNLSYLNISSNQLESVPVGLFNLRCLTSLILSYNRIVNLEWRAGLESLEHLDLSNNCIIELGEIPSILAGCSPRLKTLLISNNDLRVIPPEIGLLTNLQSVDLRGNPQRSIRPTVLEGSCTSLLTFLRHRMEEKDIRRFQNKQKAAAARVTRKGDSVDKAHNEDSIYSHSSVVCCIKGSDKSSSSSSQAMCSDAACESEFSSALESLRRDIEKLTLELNNVHLTEAKKYALKKTLAMQKAKLTREERRLKAHNHV